VGKERLMVEGQIDAIDDEVRDPADGPGHGGDDDAEN
jgi:hypothetical protein